VLRFSWVLRKKGRGDDGDEGGDVDGGAERWEKVDL
jgi:hypothetical protein